jgi:hypothetical protein
LYRSPNIDREIKYTRLRRAHHLATMAEGESAFKILIGKPPGKGALDMGRSLLEWILNK